MSAKRLIDWLDEGDLVEVTFRGRVARDASNGNKWVVGGPLIWENDDVRPAMTQITVIAHPAPNENHEVIDGVDTCTYTWPNGDYCGLRYQHCGPHNEPPITITKRTLSGEVFTLTVDPDDTTDGRQAVVDHLNEVCGVRSWDGSGIGGAFCVLPMGHTGLHSKIEPDLPKTTRDDEREKAGQRVRAIGNAMIADETTSHDDWLIEKCAEAAEGKP